MFRKKICRRCGSTLKNRYSFCPYCGNNILDKKEEDFGMLGKNDLLNEQFSNNSGFSGGFNMILNSLIRNMEKQFKEIEKQNQNNFEEKRPEEMGNISINISSFGGKSPLVKVSSLPVNRQQQNTDKKKKFVDTLPADKLKKFSSLPREQPETNIRRLSNKLIYEISLPGVKSMRDISLVNLEKNRELKAVSEKKSYLKFIPNFPILNYKLSKGKLILELDASEN